MKIISEEELLSLINNPYHVKMGKTEEYLNSLKELFPNPIPTVDIAVIKEEKVLLGRKTSSIKWRFPGGFCESFTQSNEEDARRELLEETDLRAGLNTTEPTYLFSLNIDDPRYIDDERNIRTSFFICTYKNGKERALDDLACLKWIDYNKVDIEDIEECHKPLFQKLKDYLNGKS